jgi:hypothetical protein
MRLLRWVCRIVVFLCLPAFAFRLESLIND